jgi:hypothetical protein
VAESEMRAGHDNIKKALAKVPLKALEYRKECEYD